MNKFKPFTQILILFLIMMSGVFTGRWSTSGTALQAGEEHTDNHAIARAAAPVAWYKFDGDTSDASGNNYHGALQGNPTSVTGKDGQAYHFDGTDDYISVDWNAPIQGENQSFTLAAWLKTDDTNGEHWVLADNDGWFHFLFGLHRGHLSIRWRHGEESTDYSLDTYQTVAGDWMHIAATYDAVTHHVCLYINGRLAIADTTSLPLGVKDFSALHIGKGRTAEPSEYFEGSIDEVRVYDEALVDEEIQILAGDSYQPLVLRGDPADRSIFLSWAVDTRLPKTSTWRIDYSSSLGNSPSPITDIDSNTRSYLLSGLSNDATYTVKISALTGDTVLFTQTANVTPSNTAQHPRLFFSGQDVLALREAGRTTHAEIRQPILEYATSLLGSSPPEYPGADYSALTQAANRLIPLAFAYQITGDERFSDLSRQHLLAYADWPYWGGDSQAGDRDLTLSYMLQANALAYDWVYEQMPETERATVRSALANHTQEQYEAALGPYNSSWRNWWWASYAQNHWHINNTATGMAALALEGEDSRTTTWLDHVVAQMKINTDVLNSISDGTWHESVYYQNMMLTLSMPFYDNLQRLKGQDIFPDAYLQNFILWKLYNYLPGTRQYALSYSSFFISWGWNAGDHQNILRLLARQYRSGRAEWLAQQIIANDGRYATIYHAHNYVFEFLYYDPTVTAVPPTDLPHNRTFSDLESVIWRTGWGNDEIVFGLRSGPYGGRFLYETYLDDGYPFNLATGDELNVGHNQPDANTFYIYKGDTDLSSELPIRAREQTTQLHNTLLVDGNDQYFADYHNRIYEDTDARLEAVYETPNFGYLASDATDRYRQQNDDGPGSPGDWMIDEFTRYVLFVKPNYLVMVDNIRADTPHQYDWLCHAAEDGTITMEGDWGKLAANTEDILGVRVLAPSNYTSQVETSSHEYTSHTKPRLQIRPATDVANTRFVMALYPTDNTGWNTKPTMTLLANSEQAAGVRVASDGTQDHLFKYSADAQVTIDEYTLAGDVASVAKDNPGNLNKIFLGNGTALSDNNGTRSLLQSSSAITIEVAYMGSSLALYGKHLQGLRIYAPGISLDQVTLNGQKAAAIREGDYIIVFGTAPLVLHGTAADQTIHLTWEINTTSPFTGTWQIDYYTTTVTAPLTVTLQQSEIRNYTLSPVTNYQMYTITLKAILDNTVWLSDTVQVIPTDRLVYLPLIRKENP